MDEMPRRQDMDDLVGRRDRLTAEALIDVIATAVRQRLTELRPLPCRVDEMTPREYLIAQQAFEVVGLLQWIDGLIFRVDAEGDREGLRDNKHG